MLQVAILVVIAWLSISYSLIHERAETEHLSQLSGDVAATNFLNYRQSLVNYRIANPTATGTIAYASLTVPTGYIQDSRWTNLITGGTLYVYSTVSPPPMMINATYQKSGKYIMVGIKLASGDLSGPRGVVTASLPGAIPTGAIVYIGG
jgi:hypothetical protein